jgi:cyclopropane fatty-acyl-phospholipid synthase-like methyltransferase
MIRKKPSLLDEALVPSRLKALWAEVDTGRLTSEQCYARQQEWIGGYAEIWADGLLLPGENDLKHSLCVELGKLEGCDNLAEIERRCRSALRKMKEEWNAGFSEGDAEFAVKYYDKSTHYPYELMWWHTLAEDQSPLAYVAALHLALQNGFKNSLDFGAGVGSGGLLFFRHGFTIALADVSSTLLDFSRRRLEARGIPATFIDLKTNELPAGKYDFITAMDVFEHIAEPEKAVEPVAGALRSGGILFGRFSVEPDEDRPSHIARDFGPTFDRLAELGFEECWRDDWLWGHQAFRKVAETEGQEQNSEMSTTATKRLSGAGLKNFFQQRLQRPAWRKYCVGEDPRRLGLRFIIRLNGADGFRAVSHVMEC